MESTAILTTSDYTGKKQRKDAVPKIDARLITQLANVVKGWIERGYKGSIDFQSFSVPDAFKVEGKFKAFDQRHYTFSVDLKGTGTISYEFDKRATPRRFHSLRLDTLEHYDSTKKKQKPRCSNGTPCGDSCQAKGNVCRLSLAKYSSPSERTRALSLSTQVDRRLQLGLTKTGKTEVKTTAPKSKYQNMSIRELQKEARNQGVTNYNNRKKEDLQKILETLESSPEQRTILRDTLNRRNKEKQYAIRAVPAFYRKQWKDFGRTMKVINQLGTGGSKFAAVAMTSYLMSVSNASYNKLKSDYRGGLEQSAQMAFKQSKKIKPVNTWRPNVTFAIGGGKKAGNGANKIKEMLVGDGSDKSTAGSWFRTSHAFSTIDYDSVEFDIKSPKDTWNKLNQPGLLGRGCY